VVPDGYDVSSQRLVGLFAAQLDEQLRSVTEAVAELDTAHLEWQPRPGMNTVGMLMAHLAISEAYWMTIAVAEMPFEPNGDNVIFGTIGIRLADDGIPMDSEARHPAILAGKSRADYVNILQRARQATHGVISRWTDSDLDQAYRLGETAVARSWTLYHLVEHFAIHGGQMLLLKHLMRDANMLEKEKV